MSLPATVSSTAPAPRADHRVAAAAFVCAAVVLMMAVAAWYDREPNVPWTVDLGSLVIPLVAQLALLSWAAARQRRLLVELVVLCALSAACGLVWGVCHKILIGKLTHDAASWGGELSWGVVQALFFYGVWALGFRVPALVADAQARAADAQRLELEAAALELRARVQPHFLLNTLNAIAALTLEAPREARRLIAILGDLLRESLDEGEALSPLGHEIAWLERYGELLRARYPTLVVRWDIDAAARGLRLPRLLLQPLFENAILHGALRGSGAQEVLVRARRHEGQRLECVIEDSGPGAGAPLVEGTGLRLTRRRLGIVDGTLEVDPRPGRFRVTVRLRARE